MRLKALICDVLAKEFYYWALQSEHIIDIELIPSEHHDKPERIHKILQTKLHDFEDATYDYILLGYGLCGKVLEGLRSGTTPLVVPRVHDCITLFMGTKNTFDKFFLDNPGTMYYIDAWLERHGLYKERRELDSLGLGGTFEEYVEKYGEEGANYLMEIANEWRTHYSQAIYMETFTAYHDFEIEVKALADERKWKYNKIKGDSSLIKKLLFGHWLEQDFLIVKENSEIIQTGDNAIIRSIKY